MPPSVRVPCIIHPTLGDFAGMLQGISGTSTGKNYKTTQEDYIKEERGRKITDEGIIVKTSGGLSEDWTYRRYKSEDIWAFEKLKDVKIPKGYNNPIDAFIGEQLKKIKLRPAEPADFRTLIKRAYYDLIGLPPTPFEIYKFRLNWETTKIRRGTI